MSPTAGATVRQSYALYAYASDNVGVTSVEYLLDGVLLGTASQPFPTSGPTYYSLTWNSTSAANGAHTVTAQARDAAGFVTSASASVTLDNDYTPPTVALTAPTEGSVLAGIVTVTADATDNVGVTQVTFYRGSTVLGTDTTAPYSVTWDTLGTANASYTLTSKAFDPTGNATTSAGVSVTVSNAGAGGPLVNGGFEGSSSPWALFGQAAWFANGTLPHGGNGYVELGRINSATSSIEQLITVPASAPSLSFWMYITTTETTTSVQNDQLFVEVLTSSGTLLGTLATYSNLNRGTQYSLRSFSLSAYAGQLVRLRFRTTMNGSLATTFRLDDVAVQ